MGGLHTDIFKSSPGLINSIPFVSISDVVESPFFAVNYPLFMFGRILITPSLVISVGGREKKNYNPSGAYAEHTKK